MVRRIRPTDPTYCRVTCTAFDQRPQAGGQNPGYPPQGHPPGGHQDRVIILRIPLLWL